MNQEVILKIRDAALAHLLDRSIPFKVRWAIRTLKTTSQNFDVVKNIDFMEANILTRLANGAPGQRIQNQLGKVFRRCRALGDINRFEVFKGHLIAAEKQGANLNGVYFYETFDNMDEDLIWSQTGAVVEQVKGLVGDVWLNSGTLLGSVREGGLIGHDDDIDLAVMLDANCAKTAAQAWIRAFRALQDAGLDPRATLRNPRVFKFKGNEVKIDLFPAWMEDGKIWIYPHSAGELGQAELYPLGTCQKSGLPIPANPEAFLELNYGKGWKVPDPAFEFNWHRANKKYAEFGEALTVDGLEWADRERKENG